MMAVPALAGELDAAVADRVYAALHGSLERGSVGLIVDFSQVTFCDSATISMLIRLAKNARDTGRYFAVVATHRAVTRPITILGMQTLFNVHSTVNGALAAFVGSEGHEPAR